jgi:hypothetical protein
MSSNASLRLGYDSLGGGCYINQIHFETLFLSDYGMSSFEIEDQAKSILFATKLQHYEQEEEIEMVLL